MAGACAASAGRADAPGFGPTGGIRSRAMPVAVVSDSTHYVPPEIVRRHGIETVSLYVSWDGRTDRESQMGDFGAFYDHLERAETLPSTSQLSVGDFLEVYEPLLDRG